MGQARIKNNNLEYYELTAPLAVSFVVAQRCIWNGIIFQTDHLNDITVNVYDNNIAAASARQIWPANYYVIGAQYNHVINTGGIMCHQGVAVLIAVAGGGTCSYQIAYNVG